MHGIAVMLHAVQDNVWSAQVSYSIERVKATVPRLLALAQGGTAVGTGLNAKKGFAEGFAQAVADDTGQLCVSMLLTVRICLPCRPFRRE